MNKLAFILAIIIALVFFYAKISWLGFIFILLAIIVIVYKPTKDYANEGWEQMKKADGGVPDKKLDSYAKLAGKQIIDVMGKDPKKTVAARKAPGEKLIKGSQNFFKELDELFK